MKWVLSSSHWRALGMSWEVKLGNRNYNLLYRLLPPAPLPPCYINLITLPVCSSSSSWANQSSEYRELRCMGVSPTCRAQVTSPVGCRSRPHRTKQACVSHRSLVAALMSLDLLHSSVSSPPACPATIKPHTYLRHHLHNKSNPKYSVIKKYNT